MPDIEKVIKGLEMHEKKRAGVGCLECPYAEAEGGTDDWCIRGLHRDILAILKEQEAQERKWLQTIADNQIANAPNDSPMSLDEMLESEYKSGICEGLQMAFEILMEGR